METHVKKLTKETLFRVVAFVVSKICFHTINTVEEVSAVSGSGYLYFVCSKHLTILKRFKLG